LRAIRAQARSYMGATHATVNLIARERAPTWSL
jgi:hypothetical protein